MAVPPGRLSIVSLILAPVLTPLLGCAPEAAPAPAPVNVVLIVADDLGWSETDVNVPGSIPTPALGRLADEGVRFTSAYALAPICGPSRAALVTGRYPQRFGFEHNPRSDGDGLPADVPTLAEEMAAAGYATGLVGKWHLGIDDAQYPTQRGYGAFFGILGGQTSYADPLREDIVTHRLPPVVWNSGQETSFGPGPRDQDRLVLTGPDRQIVRNEDEYLTDALTDQALAFVDRHQARPFFLHLSYTAPHVPLQAPRELVEAFAFVEDPVLRIYWAMVASLDAGIGRLLDGLDARGLTETTLVIFLSDNGCAHYTGLCACEPLRGGKGSLLEGGVRVPFLVRWPGELEPGTVHDGVVSALDVLPTALAAAGRPAPGADGEDLRAVLADGEERAVYFRSVNQRAMRRGAHKLWASPIDGIQRMYDLGDDPGEARDLAEARPGRFEALVDDYVAWSEELAEPAWPVSDRLTGEQCGDVFTIVR